MKFAAAHPLLHVHQVDYNKDELELRRNESVVPSGRRLSPEGERQRSLCHSAVQTNLGALRHVPTSVKYVEKKEVDRQSI